MQANESDEAGEHSTDDTTEHTSELDEGSSSTNDSGGATIQRMSDERIALDVDHRAFLGLVAKDGDRMNAMFRFVAL